MKDSIRRKLEKLDERFEEISRLLSDAGVIGRQNQFRELSMEYSRLGPLVERYRRVSALQREFGFSPPPAAGKNTPAPTMGEGETARLGPRLSPPGIKAPAPPVPPE